LSIRLGFISVIGDAIRQLRCDKLAGAALAGAERRGFELPVLFGFFLLSIITRKSRSAAVFSPNLSADRSENNSPFRFSAVTPLKTSSRS
jgi:hypothetical protein